MHRDDSNRGSASEVAVDADAAPDTLRSEPSPDSSPSDLEASAGTPPSPSPAKLEEWEGEGGSVAPPPAEPKERADARAHVLLHRLLQ